jgi:hypothetical protein
MGELVRHERKEQHGEGEEEIFEQGGLRRVKRRAKVLRQREKTKGYLPWLAGTPYY